MKAKTTVANICAHYNMLSMGQLMCISPHDNPGGERFHCFHFADEKTKAGEVNYTPRFTH